MREQGPKSQCSVWTVSYYFRFILKQNAHHTLLLISSAFQVKDAREKLGQKDARFRIQARGATVSTVQDARQTINSRKQQQVQDSFSPLVTTSQTPIPHIHIQNNNHNASSTGVRAFPANQGLATRVGMTTPARGGITKVVDARDRLSLKRSVSSLPSQGSAAPLKITKTIQVNEEPFHTHSFQVFYSQAPVFNISNTTVTLLCPSPCVSVAETCRYDQWDSHQRSKQSSSGSAHTNI